jgi:hypothetical protein
MHFAHMGARNTTARFGAPACAGLHCGTAAVAATMMLFSVQLSAQTRPENAVTLPVAGDSKPFDYANAMPQPLPKLRDAPSSLLESLAINQTASMESSVVSVSMGHAGNGKLTAIRLAPAKDLTTSSAPGPVPEQFGTALHPFTTSRANPQGNLTTNFYPFRATGKLF